MLDLRKNAVLAVVILALAPIAFAAEAKKDSPKQKQKAQKEKVKHEVVASDDFMGDYQGTIRSANGAESGIVAQVMALGDGAYQANLLAEFDQRAEPLAVLEGTLEGDKVVFGQSATLEGDCLAGKLDGEFEMKKVFRRSPTLGAAPPEGAIVLFDGTSTDQWLKLDRKTQETGPCEWTIAEDGAMEIIPGRGWARTEREFLDIRLHMEFRTPFVPTARGQARGNSGVYIQGRYEAQILDSYGLEGKDNECGGLYKIAVPLVNMCFPPLQWQTYDIVFHAPRFDGDGARTTEARLTVEHNGVTIHDDVALPGPTHVAPFKGSGAPGPIVLQDHGWPVRFRNIWVVELPL
jgi:hypothetical protein